MNMKVLFLNPPFLKKFSRPQRSPAVTKSGALHFPLWLASAGGVLIENGFDVDLIDAPAEGLSIDDVEGRVRAFGPSLMVIDTSTPSIKNDVSVAGRLKDLCPASFVCLVGTHVSALAEDVLRMDKRIDAAARGEYDYTVLDLAKTLKGGFSLKGVLGIAYRQGDDVVCNQRRPFICNLDELPFVSKVYKRFLKTENYFHPNALFPTVTIASSRGCPFPCTFCLYPQTLMGRKFRKRSVENVVAEMEYIAATFPQAKSIFFEDDTLTIDDKRLLELAALIRKRRLKMPWAANSRIGLSYEAMRAIRGAGCRSLCVGFESGSQDILDSMKKKTRINEMHEFMRGARRAGILIHGCFMAGLPGETKETLRATFELAKSLNPDTVQFYPVMVYPGTEAYDWYFRRGLIKSLDFSKWITPEGLHNTVVRTEGLASEEIVRFCDAARKDFYLRPRYVLYKLRQMVNSPREIKRTFNDCKTFLKRILKGTGAEMGGGTDANGTARIGRSI